MICNRVHGDGKSQDMASHDEDHQEQLACSEELPAKSAHDDLAGITHGMDERVSPFKLPNRVSSVGGHQTQRYKENDGSTFVRVVGGGE